MDDAFVGGRKKIEPISRLNPYEKEGNVGTGMNPKVSGLSKKKGVLVHR